MAPDKARVGCVYKNVAILEEEKIIPKIKVSAEIEKTINPGYKKVYRFYDKETKQALGDVVALYNEKLPKEKYTLINPEDRTGRKTIENYEIKELQEPIFIKGTLVYEDKDIYSKREYCNEQMKTLYPEVKRILKPHKYYVDLSENLLNLKEKMIQENKVG